MNQVQTMKLALDALEGADGIDVDMRDAITALRAAIEQAEGQEPVVGTKTWVNENGELVTVPLSRSDVYSAPAQPVQPVQEPVALPTAHERAAKQAQTDGTVTPEYLAWLKSLYPATPGVGGNEAWNAGVAWAKAQPAPKPLTDDLLYALDQIVKTVPAQDGGGGFIAECHGPDGEYLGCQQVDPMRVVQEMQSIACHAIEAAHGTKEQA
jgi:hypothetical protein